MNNENYTIAEHWDPNAEISRDDDPQTEYNRWREFAKAASYWSGDEFTLADFETYIANQSLT